ncbi:GNAT family N-acetyltransferase [Sandaracinus amylolyticus]|uniref:GNAT family acetyltransferase n=1 Tax=Sandaracinus amylolyticus TaxID=927083 RepID=A0A0F6W8M1_9BACT|nr:GNAT family N-acetyltransferase [Sandaracinus amylolyticus]AKF10115.1 GNAT family acetyltransferase [Sandaracinus amylolyticus]
MRSLDLDAAFASFPVLETERLVLRAATDDDAPDLFRILSDPQVMRYFGRAPATVVEQARERLTMTDDAFRAREGIRWVLSLRGDPRMIGSCSIWRIDRKHLRGEVGYELAPEQWGRGLMPEALRAIVRFGFDVLRLHGIEGRIDPDNRGSARVLEKVGFAQEAYFRESYYDEQYDRFTDEAVYCALSTTWKR